MAGSRGKALFLSLLVGLLTALGVAAFLAILYAITGIWLSGHSRVLWGWDGTYVTGLNWLNLVFQAGILLSGLLATVLCYRAWRPPGNHRHDD
jgi:hypothetical protein